MLSLDITLLLSESEVKGVLYFDSMKITRVGKKKFEFIKRSV